jgi:hypothetical protein
MECTVTFHDHIGRAELAAAVEPMPVEALHALLESAVGETARAALGQGEVEIELTLCSDAEMEWARDAGLRGVNFPAPQPWFPEFNKRLWDPLWSTAEAVEMPLVTHIGAGADADYSGPDGRAVNSFEGI